MDNQSKTKGAEGKGEPSTTKKEKEDVKEEQTSEETNVVACVR